MPSFLLWTLSYELPPSLKLLRAKPARLKDCMTIYYVLCITGDRSKAKIHQGGIGDVLLGGGACIISGTIRSEMISGTITQMPDRENNNHSPILL